MSILLPVDQYNYCNNYATTVIDGHIIVIAVAINKAITDTPTAESNRICEHNPTNYTCSYIPLSKVV